MFLMIDTDYEAIIYEKDGVFTSTKTEQVHLHGIGIKNVERAVKQLNGKIEISHTEDTFHVRITLPNYN